MSTTTRTPAPRLGAVAAVRLVAARELATRLRTKSFLISNAILLAVIIGGIVLTSVLTGGPSEPDRVGVVGQPPLGASVAQLGDQLGTPVTVVPLADAAAARSDVASGDLDVALLPGSGGAVTAVSQDTLDDGLRTVLDAAVTRAATDQALTDRGVDPTDLATATAGAVVTAEQLDPPADVDGERLALAYIAVILLYIQLLTAGLTVASGVVEEKTSRVVELLLSTLKPLHLLVGKIVGIGIVGLVQLAAYGVAGLVTGVATGLITATGTAVAVFAMTLFWFLLGYAFFAVLYAATGSMVSRQEEVASTTTPLTMLVLAMFFLGQFALQDPTGTVPTVFSWIPPFSAVLMPLRIAAGVTGPVQVVGTALLMVVAVVALSYLAAGIYRRSVLRTGTRVGWREAISRS